MLAHVEKHLSLQVVAKYLIALGPTNPVGVGAGIGPLTSWVSLAVLVKKCLSPLISKLDSLILWCQQQNAISDTLKQCMLVFIVRADFVSKLNHSAETDADKCHKGKTHAKVVELLEDGG